jgi:signal transduction histidine kinase
MPRTSSFVQRALRRLLAGKGGEVRALEQAIHLEGVLRFIGLFGMTMVLPAILLAYFGVASIEVEEQGVLAEVDAEARDTANSFWAALDRRFTNFEARVHDRLESGRSPLEGRGELDPYLLFALRFSEEGELVAPFVLDPTVASPAVQLLFEPAYQSAVAAEDAGDLAAAARLYAEAGRAVGTPAALGRARFDRARLLAAGGNPQGLLDLQAVADEFGPLRDPWGMRLGDLARLRRAELLLQRDPEAGALALRGLVEELLSTPWVLHEGAESAITTRAISTLESTPQREWASGARARASERHAMLFWATELWTELTAQVNGPGPLRTSPGSLQWRQGERALWVTTWWDNSYLVFALDLEAIVGGLKAEARANTGAKGTIHAWVAPRTEAVPPSALAVKNLSPYLGDWSLVVAPRDIDALRAASAARRNKRVAVIGIALSMIVLGAVLTIRLIKRELDVARMKTDFAASVSHELRSPITQIRLKGESLLLGLTDTDEEREMAYQDIVRESERLSRLVDNVLDFSAIERGAKRYTLRPGDLVETVYRAIDSISSAQEVIDKELDVDLPPDLPEVAHDADAVAQCVINLVSNAAKYSSPGGWIGVRGRVVEGGVEITVSDKGIGIAAHDLKQLFEPFFRSRDALARRRKGTGIGLTITRYIMVAHGGDVFVQSKPGQGSTFTLRFPPGPPEGIDSGGPLKE